MALVREQSPRAPAGVERPRRILLVVHGYPPHQATGGEVHARRKARWWRARGHLVSIVAADPQSPAQLPHGQVEERDDLVDDIPVRRVRYAITDATRPLVESYRHPLLAGVLEREIARFAPDLIYQVSGFIFGTLPLEIAARRGIPAALFAVDFWPVCQRITLLRPDGTCCPGPAGPADCAACRLTDRGPARRGGPALGRLGWRALATVGGVAAGPLATRLGVADFAAREAAIAEGLRGVALVIASSRFLADRLEGLGVPPERLLVMRQGIAGDEFAAPPARRDPPGGPLRLLFLGQISHHKGADLAVEAVARLRAAGVPVALSLHGPPTDSAAYAARLAARIAALNRRHGACITLGPPLDRALLAPTIGRADLLLVPSRWYDNSPNVILEAFAMGVPVIAAGHGGQAAMVRDGVDGLHFRPGDARALAGAIRRAADDPALLARLRSGVRRPYGLDEEMVAEEAALGAIIAAGGAR